LLVRSPHPRRLLHCIASAKRRGSSFEPWPDSRCRSTDCLDNSIDPAKTWTRTPCRSAPEDPPCMGFTRDSTSGESPCEAGGVHCEVNFSGFLGPVLLTPVPASFSGALSRHRRFLAPAGSTLLDTLRRSDRVPLQLDHVGHPCALGTSRAKTPSVDRISHRRPPPAERWIALSGLTPPVPASLSLECADQPSGAPSVRLRVPRMPRCAPFV